MTTTTYAIYPSIGVARVGNAPTEFYIGPETYCGLPILPDGAQFKPKDFRDREGRLRRQAARFRIYRETPDGAEEITLATPGVKDIRWTVHLANKKAAWYEFLTSSGENGYPSNHPLRNRHKESVRERRQLFIDAGPRSIAGRNAGSGRQPVEFSRSTIPPGYKGGAFPSPSLKPFTIDTLGALQTDRDGRLLVLGGYGRSGSTADHPRVVDYANNDHWWDDTSDGPVTATITLDSGQTFEVEPAWVLVAPPKYAPQLANLVTLHDTIFDCVVRSQGLRPEIYRDGLWNGGARGYKPSFETDIRPIFDRAAGYRWVAAIPPKPHHFDFGKLGNPDPALNEFRKYYLDAIRPPDSENVLVDAGSGITMMPYLAGDDCIKDDTTLTKSKFLRLTETQYFFLQQWAAGHFEVAARPESHPGRRLTRAVLENCVGGAFSPGIEVTWISRNPAIYAAPFRLRARAAVPDPLSLGLDIAAGLEPGDLTRYMALPWQADFNECASQPIGDRVLWWWPVQRPEFVYIEPERRKPKQVKVRQAKMSLAKSAKSKSDDNVQPHDEQVPWLGQEYDQNADNYISFADDLTMVTKWVELGFLYDIGTDGSERFVEYGRKRRESSADEP